MTIQKSLIRETLNLMTCAVSKTNTINNVICHVLHVLCPHSNETDRAMDAPPPKSPILHGRLFLQRSKCRIILFFFPFDRAFFETKFLNVISHNFYPCSVIFCPRTSVNGEKGPTDVHVRIF